MTESREYTEEEVRQQFLEHIWELIDYWGKLPNISEREKMEGLAFSILVTLDGGSMATPAFIVAPLAASEDKEYLIKNEENWYPENHESNVKCDIGGCLHELFDKYKKED